MAPLPHSGHPAVEAYLTEGYDRVVGMSSRFAAAVCARLLRLQTEEGVAGPIAAANADRLGDQRLLCAATGVVMANAAAGRAPTAQITAVRKPMTQGSRKALPRAVRTSPDTKISASPLSCT